MNPNAGLMVLPIYTCHLLVQPHLHLSSKIMLLYILKYVQWFRMVALISLLAIVDILTVQSSVQTRIHNAILSIDTSNHA